MFLTDNQQEYYDSIKNGELKELLESSFTFLTMSPGKQDGFLLWLSEIHLDSEAEKKVVELFKNEIEVTDQIMKSDDEEDPTPEVADKIVKFAKKQHQEMESGMNELEQAVEEEKDLNQF
jgi:hypothetical protein